METPFFSIGYSGSDDLENLLQTKFFINLIFVKNVIKIGSLLSFIGLVCLYVYKKKKEHKEFVINEYSLVDLYNFNLDTN